MFKTFKPFNRVAPFKTFAETGGSRHGGSSKFNVQFKVQGKRSQDVAGKRPFNQLAKKDRN
jgi:hypothetical protein